MQLIASKQYIVRFRVNRGREVDARILMLEVHRGLYEEQAARLAVISHRAWVYGHLLQLGDDVPLRDDFIVAWIEVVRVDARGCGERGWRGNHGGRGLAWDAVSRLARACTRRLTVPLAVSYPCIPVEVSAKFFREVRVRTQLHTMTHTRNKKSRR